MPTVEEKEKFCHLEVVGTKGRKEGLGCRRPSTALSTADRQNSLTLSPPYPAPSHPYSEGEKERRAVKSRKGGRRGREGSVRKKRREKKSFWQDLICMSRCCLSVGSGLREKEKEEEWKWRFLLLLWGAAAIRLVRKEKGKL